MKDPILKTLLFVKKALEPFDYQVKELRRHGITLNDKSQGVDPVSITGKVISIGDYVALSEALTAIEIILRNHGQLE